MRKLVAIVLTCMSVFSLMACGSENNNDSNTSSGEKYVFSYNNVDVKMDEKAEDIIKNLGGEPTYFEAASCAFDGLDKQYKYGDSFEVGTYPKDDVDYISYVYIYDDSVSTKEGVKVGDSVDTMKEKYGDAEENTGSYEYSGDDMTLRFIISDNAIEEIDYCSNATKQ